MTVVEERNGNRSDCGSGSIIMDTLDGCEFVLLSVWIDQEFTNNVPSVPPPSEIYRLERAFPFMTTMLLVSNAEVKCGITITIGIRTT